VDDASVDDANDLLADLKSATRRLLDGMGRLSDAAARQPSLLPGWSRGHVLTHLARNAEGSTRLLTWARTGVPSYEYESAAARATEIEAGAGRPAGVLAEDVRRTAAALEEAATGMPPRAWRRVVRYTGGQERPADVILPSRLAEVLIHHVDLDLGFTPEDWPRPFVADMLTLLASSLSQRDGVTALRLASRDGGGVFTIGDARPADVTVTGSEPELLAWLLGRADGRGLGREPDGPLPAIPAIY
jgi:maleylpyruvate isomerase